MVALLLRKGNLQAHGLHCHRSRPKSVNEVAYQEEVVHTLQKALESANVGASWLLVLRTATTQDDGN